jgi:hypothetical protein
VYWYVEISLSRSNCEESRGWDQECGSVLIGDQ